MKRLVLLALAVLFVTSLTGSAMAATWYSMGATGFGMTNAMQNDYDRAKYCDIMADAAGNIYVAQNITDGTGRQRGAVTVYQTDGSKSSYLLGSEVDKDNGSIMKLVKGGDGNVYCGMNYCEINWGGAWQREAIVKLNTTSATEIWSPGDFSTGNHIQGIAVGGDGNVYWTMDGSYWKDRFFWRYNVGLGQVEESPINGTLTNQGWGERHSMQDLVYVGNGMFGVVNRGSSSWYMSAMSWTQTRTVAINERNNPGWGRKQSTDINYDSVHNAVWGGARGDGNRNISGRWNGDDLDGLFDENPGGNQPGIAGNDVYHTLATDADMGAQYWVTGQDVSADGDWWFGVKANNDVSGLAGWRGKVIRQDGDTLAIYDEGSPEALADVAGLASIDGGTYVLMWNRANQQYTLYTSVPEPTSLLALGTGLIGVFGFIRRRR